MLQNLKPILEHINLTLILKKKKDSADDFVLVVVPTPSVRTKDPKLNKATPFTLVGELDKLELEFNGDGIYSKLVEFKREVVKTGKLEDPSKRTAPKKPEVPAEVRSLLDKLDGAEKLIDEKNWDGFKVQWPIVLKEAKALKEKDMMTPAIKGRLELILNRYNKADKQTTLL